jgi:hypothetical protein
MLRNATFVKTDVSEERMERYQKRASVASHF